MECPKCHSRHIRRVAVITTPSSLERYDDDQAWVEGESCLMCGYWADVGPEPAAEPQRRRDNL
ncbi:hypothetical protein F6V25_14525 [Oryzomonas japonica]|uniref:Uncharacterized protein n=1 Tax=Oryzomonas japonica TaxID=2603858 RepID=A0A7J4ZN79_9BACT|nr:hypothetical protein [Oryzomonas japonica]KAB0664022.1 hypothetical protein F6V25_14525 [Oryzomonas japonica]